MKDFSRSVLSSEGIALDIERRLNWLLVLFAAIFFVFSATNYLQGSTAMAVSDIIVAGCILVINFVLQKRIVPAIIIVYLLLLLVAMAVVSELVFQGAISSFLYYYGIIPFYVYYIAGKRIATGYTIFLLVVVWATWILSKVTSTLEFQYSLQELLFFTPLLAFSAFCAWLFEEDRHETEEMSYEAGLRHESLLEAIGEVYYRVDNDGQIIEMSSALYQITGYKPSEVIMNPTIDFYAYPEERQGYVEMLAMHGSVENYAITIVGKAGNHIRIQMSSRLILDKEGKPKYIEGMFRDITKEQKVEEERKEHLEHLEKLSHIENLLAHSKLEQGIQNAVQELLATFQAERAFLIPLCMLRQEEEDACEPLSFVEVMEGSIPFDLKAFLQDSEVAVYFSSIPKHRKYLRKVLDGAIFSPQLLGKHGIHSHVMILLQTSAEQYWLLSLHNIEAGKFSEQQRRLFIDVSRRIGASLTQLLLQNELQEAVITAEVASKAKGEFVATMSHELRTPLHGLIGLLDLMGAEEDKLSLEQRQNLALAQSSAQVLRSLIDDVLDLSKIESGKIEMKKQAFNLQQALSDALIPFVMKAREKGIGLNLEMCDVAEVVEGDVLRLRQVLLNLVGNAIKFTVKGYVRIVVSQDEEMLHIHIEDSGIGIDKEKHEVVFSPFEQVHNEQVLGENLQEKGTGLGTTIAQYFVKMMGGTLTLQSEPDVGSTMTIRLPLQQVGNVKVSVDLQMDDLIKTPSVKSSHQVLGANVSSARSYRVLLAEDDPVGRRVVVKRLRAAGLEVEVVADGEAAYQQIQNDSFDLLLTDIRMPGLSGLQLTKKIRFFEQKKGARPMVIIGLSAYALEDVKAEALAAGMDDFISKPVDMQVLIEILDKKFLD